MAEEEKKGRGCVGWREVGGRLYGTLYTALVRVCVSRCVWFSIGNMFSGTCARLRSHKILWLMWA